MNKFNGDHINAIAGHKSGVNRKKLNTADSYNEIRHWKQIIFKKNSINIYSYGMHGYFSKICNDYCFRYCSRRSIDNISRIVDSVIEIVEMEKG